MRRVVSATSKTTINGTNTAGQPMGLLSQASGSVSFSAATPTQVELLSMIEAIGDADGDLSRCSWLMHPSTAAALMRTERATGSGFCIEPMNTRQWHCNGLPVLMSTHIPEQRSFCSTATQHRLFISATQLLLTPTAMPTASPGLQPCGLQLLRPRRYGACTVVVGTARVPADHCLEHARSEGRAFSQSNQNNGSQFRSSEGPRLDEPSGDEGRLRMHSVRTASPPTKAQTPGSLQSSQRFCD